jgi:hypothetical protein
MEHTMEVLDPHDREAGAAQEISAAEVQATLAEIFQSPPFHASKQLQEFLKYIVDQTLSGHLEMLKERIIGANVFGRRPDYDTNDDPIVRARAAEVRKRLAQYYLTLRDASVVRIDIPSGSYRPTFERIEDRGVSTAPTPKTPLQPSATGIEAPAKTLEPPLVSRAEEPDFQRSRNSHWFLALALTALIAIGVGLHFFISPEERAFNKFWSPLLETPNPVLIYVGSNVVYQLSSGYVDGYHREHPMSPAEERGLETDVVLSPGSKLNAEDIVPRKDTFVTIGDVAAATKFVSLLVHRDKQFDIRYGSDLVFGDLRQSPAVLIGAHNNLWTVAMTDNLRFVFDSQQSIQDRVDPNRHWSATGGFTEDYAIVSRILNSKTGSTVVTAAGVGQAGTRAAAEFITNPHSVAMMVKSLPKDWEKKNMQIVLHTTVINQIPSNPDIVATHCW